MGIVLLGVICGILGTYSSVKRIAENYWKQIQFSFSTFIFIPTCASEFSSVTPGGHSDDCDHILDLLCRGSQQYSKTSGIHVSIGHPFSLVIIALLYQNLGWKGTLLVRLVVVDVTPDPSWNWRKQVKVKKNSVWRWNLWQFE